MAQEKSYWQKYYAENKEKIALRSKIYRMKKLASQGLPIGKPSTRTCLSEINFRVVKESKYKALVDAYNNLNGSNSSIEIDNPGVSNTKFKNAIVQAFYMNQLKPKIEARDGKLYVSKA